MMGSEARCSQARRSRRAQTHAAVRPTRARGLTLLEVILALALTILLLSGVLAFYQSVLRAREHGSQYAREVILARQLLQQMAEEIRQATDVVPGDGVGFRGRRDSITIVRARVPERYAFDVYDTTRDELPPAQMDLERIQYSLVWDDELEDDEGNSFCHGMWRSYQKTFDPNPRFTVDTEVEDAEDMASEDDGYLSGPQAEGELYAPEIKYLRFKYFDGAEWRKQWQDAGDEGEGLDMGQAASEGKATYALPQAIMITIGREPVPPEDLDLELEADAIEEDEEDEEELEEYHPDRFTIVVYLPEADTSLLSSRQYGVKDQLGRESGIQ